MIAAGSRSHNQYNLFFDNLISIPLKLGGAAGLER
jgi:hypothetical protein